MQRYNFFLKRSKKKENEKIDFKNIKPNIKENLSQIKINGTVSFE